ncbi:MAG: energy-coupling factor ABC transporter permease [Nitrospinota bacterium]
MHIPDGFLEPEVWIPLTAISGMSLVSVSRKISDGMDEEAIPLMGVLAAFVFAAQMINFPVGGGTSGHLMGGVLIAAIVGPYRGLIIMSTILILQALLFQDGGITALGANIFNMGIVGTLFGYLTFKGTNYLTGSVRFSVFTASWFSVVAASAFTAIELSLSGIIPMKVSLPAMIGVYSIIGIGEGTITISALELVSKVKKETIMVNIEDNNRIRKKSSWIWLAISIAIAAILSPFASKLPDGLERVAETFGFIGREKLTLPSLFRDYQISGVYGKVSTAIAGIMGVLIVFALSYMVMKVLKDMRNKR